MSAISIAMSGMRAASARLEVSAENLVNAQSRGAPPPSPDRAVPAANPAATPFPKVYRPQRASLYSLASSAGGDGVGVRYQPITPAYAPAYDPTASGADDSGMIAAPNVDPAAERLEQIQAAVQYRTSAAVMRTAQDMQDRALDILA